MKKNKMCRLASVLLIMVLLTTSIVGGTFAKYTTEASATDTARVAKWGVTLGTHTDLFLAEYNGTETGYDTKLTVKTSETDKKLVAPGTTGTGLGVTSAGTPEVSYRMTIKLDGASTVPSLKYTPTGGTEATYEPVKFSVYNGTTPIKADMSLSELRTLFDGTNVIYTYDVSNGKYYADTNGDGTIENTAQDDCPNIKITWKWDFETGTDNDVKKLNNELDTILGNTAAGVSPAITSYSGGSISDIKTDVSLTWTITATQID